MDGARAQIQPVKCWAPGTASLHLRPLLSLVLLCLLLDHLQGQCQIVPLSLSLYGALLSGLKLHFLEVFFFFFFFKIFTYLTERERQSTEAGGEAEGEADSPLSREPNAELDPRTPGS